MILDIATKSHQSLFRCPHVLRVESIDIFKRIVSLRFCLVLATGHFARVCRGGPRRRPGRQQQSNFVDDDNDQEAFVADCETTPQSARKYFAHLHLIQGGRTKVVKAQIDSASTCNTIPSSLLSQLFPDVKISRTKSKINTYGTKTIRPEGQVTLCCDRKGKIHTIDFLVVNVPNQKPPLLSGRGAQAPRLFEGVRR